MTWIVIGLCIALVGGAVAFKKFRAKREAMNTHESTPAIAIETPVVAKPSIAEAPPLSAQHKTSPPQPTPAAPPKPAPTPQEAFVAQVMIPKPISPPKPAKTIAPILPARTFPTAPLLIEAITPKFSVALQLQAVEGIEMPKDPKDWVVSGRNVITLFADAWSAGKIDTQADSGVFEPDLSHPLFHALRKKIAVKISLISFNFPYTLDRKFYVGRTDLIPGAENTQAALADNGRAASSVREVVGIPLDQFKVHARREDIGPNPEKILTLRLEPELVPLEKN